MRNFAGLLLVFLGLLGMLHGAYADAENGQPGQAAFCGDVPVPIAFEVTETDSRGLALGDRIQVNWHLNSCSSLNAANDLALVVFAMPNSVRLAGAGFIVFPPHSKLPFGFDWEPDKLRIAFPVYLLHDKTKGAFNFRVLTGSEFSLKGTFVSVAPDTFDIHWKDPIIPVRSYPVTEHSPSLVIQDKASVQAPNEIIESPDGQFEVHSFSGRIQVFSSQSGLMIFDEYGIEPRFSPESRFLSFYKSLDKEDNKFRVVDLLDLSTIVDTDSVTGIIWGLGDSLLVLGKKSDAGGELYFPYLDPVQPLPLGGGLSHASSFWDTGVLIDVENGFIAGNTDVGTLEFFDLIPGQSTEHLAHVEDAQAAAESAFSDSEEIPEQWSRQYLLVVRKLGLPKARAPTNRWEIVDRGKFTTMQLTNFIDDSAETSEKWIRTGFWNANFEQQSPKVRPVASGRSYELASLRQEAGQTRGSSVRSRGQVLSYGDESKEIVTSQADSRILENLEARGAQFHRNLQPSNTSNWGETTAKEFLARLNSLRKPQERLKISHLFHGECPDSYLDDWGKIKTSSWGWDGGQLSLIQTTCAGGGNSQASWGDLKFLSESPNGIRMLSFSENADRIVQMSKALGQTNNCALVFSQMEEIMGDGDVYKGKGQSNSNPNCALLALDYYDYGNNDADTHFFLSDSGKLVIAAAPISNSILVFDPASLSLETFVKDVPDAADILSLHLARNGKHLLQINETGRFFVHDLSAGKPVLNGLYIDDEVVLFREDGIYDGTPEGAQFITWYYSGLREHFDFGQFESKLKLPKLINRILNGETVEQMDLDLVSPPVVDIRLERNTSDNSSLKVTLDVSSALPLTRVRLFDDGVPIEEMAATGNRANFEASVPVKRGQHWLSAVAYNTEGSASTPKAVLIDTPKASAPSGNLFAFGVGIDRYFKMTGQDLKYAKRDVLAFEDMVKRNPAQHYDQVSAHMLTDEEATTDSILSALQEISKKATKDDTLMLYFASHGTRGADGKFYLMTSQSTFADVDGTGLAWERIAEVLGRGQGKTIVFLDACHSGATSSADTFVPNDAYVAELMKSGKSGMVVFAAAKGRQYSFEEPGLDGGHGVFNYMVTQALINQREAADENRNGIIEVNELYRYVKAQVFHHTRGKQTPWISRNEMIGEVPLL